MRLEEVSQIFKQSEQLYAEAEIAAVYDQMAAQITADLSAQRPLVLCVMNGGLVVTAELLRRMDFPLELDYAHITRYRGGTQGREAEWIRFPEERIQGRAVLIIDDILDEGITLKQLQQACTTHGAKSVSSAVLVIKQHDRRIEHVGVEYSGLTVEDRYIIGCGMDYHGYFRNLNSIYALAVPEKDLA